ncbi:MAG: hypothetical protein K9N06_02050 [Candidatus Cloacimonetes bacterium]|nr:hypothetical protein [Candidatus Cloacimonadota bacterium]
MIKKSWFLIILLGLFLYCNAERYKDDQYWKLRLSVLDYLENVHNIKTFRQEGNTLFTLQEIECEYIGKDTLASFQSVKLDKILAEGEVLILLSYFEDVSGEGYNVAFLPYSNEVVIIGNPDVLFGCYSEFQDSKTLEHMSKLSKIEFLLSTYLMIPPKRAGSDREIEASYYLFLELSGKIIAELNDEQTFTILKYPYGSAGDTLPVIKGKYLKDITSIILDIT